MKTFLDSKRINTLKMSDKQKNECLSLHQFVELSNKNIERVQKFIHHGIEDDFAFRIKRLREIKYALTKEKFILQYGEKCGQEKWDSYCNKQSVKNTFEFKKEKYNFSRKDFEDFNNSRAVTLKNQIAKYGIEEGTKRFIGYCEKQRVVGCTKEYFIYTYGEIEGTKKYIELNLKKKLNIDTFIRKYGEEEGQKQFENFLNNQKLSYSKGSQEIFWHLYHKYNLNKCYFAELNNEYGKYNKNTRTYVKFDFVDLEKMVIIEYNGDHYHANPKIYKPYDIVYKKRGPKLIASDIWKKDLDKKKLAESLGFKVYYIWESDYLIDKDTILKLIEEIYEHNN